MEKTGITLKITVIDKREREIERNRERGEFALLKTYTY